MKRSGANGRKRRRRSSRESSATWEFGFKVALSIVRYSINETHVNRRRRRDRPPDCSVAITEDAEGAYLFRRECNQELFLR